jgi:hypothetical protein
MARARQRLAMATSFFAFLRCAVETKFRNQDRIVSGGGQTLLTLLGALRCLLASDRVQASCAVRDLIRVARFQEINFGTTATPMSENCRGRDHIAQSSYASRQVTVAALRACRALTVFEG